jgi:hypothetical protein
MVIVSDVSGSKYCHVHARVCALTYLYLRGGTFDTKDGGGMGISIFFSSLDVGLDLAVVATRVRSGRANCCFDTLPRDTAVAIRIERPSVA